MYVHVYVHVFVGWGIGDDAVLCGGVAASPLLMMFVLCCVVCVRGCGMVHHRCRSPLCARCPSSSPGAVSSVARSGFGT